MYIIIYIHNVQLYTNLIYNLDVFIYIYIYINTYKF